MGYCLFYDRPSCNFRFNRIMISYNPFSLEGKTILITGASSGIGKATAIEASRLGARVIITGRNEERLTETFSLLDDSSRDHQMIAAELLDEVQRDNLISFVPSLDGLVMCAGKGETLLFQFASRDKLDNIFNINFFAPVELMRLLYKKKKIVKNASIVIMSSLGGTQIFSGGNSAYGASKAALNSIMKFCAKEFATRKVRVNSICPGMVDTPFIHRGTLSEEQLQEDQKRYLLGRYGQPEDIAHTISFLLSDASSWMTGQSLIVDGGVSVK